MNFEDGIVGICSCLVGVDQVTALAVISGNDYVKNIKHHALKTNFGIVKDVLGKKHKTIRAVVKAYCDYMGVARNTFDDALRVFADHDQTPVTPGDETPSTLQRDTLKTLSDFKASYRKKLGKVCSRFIWLEFL